MSKKELGLRITAKDIRETDEILALTRTAIFNNVATTGTTSRNLEVAYREAVAMQTAAQKIVDRRVYPNGFKGK